MALAVERGEGIKPKFFGIENPSPSLRAKAIKTFPVLPNHWEMDLRYTHFLFSRSDRDLYIAALESAGVVPFTSETLGFDNLDREDFERIGIARENAFFLNYEREEEFLKRQARLIGKGYKPDHVSIPYAGQRAFEGMQKGLLERFEREGYKVSEARLFLGELDSSVRVSMADNIIGIYGANGLLRTEAAPAQGYDSIVRKWFMMLKAVPATPPVTAAA